MSPILAILVVPILLLAAGLIALRTGLARRIFFEIYSRVAKVEVLGPGAVRIPPTNSPYQLWLARAKTELPMFDGPWVDNVETVDLRAWPQMGEAVNGLYLRLANYQTSDARILEIPQHGKTTSQRQLYEQTVYSMGGPGHTIIQRDDTQPQRINWQAGCLFSVPLNIRHQHFNDSDEPVRVIIVTSFPFMLNALNNEHFINENPFAFTDRYNASADYLERSELTSVDYLATNRVANIRESETSDMDLRGRGNRVMHWVMAGNSMLSVHISEIPPKRYKRAHRHTNDSLFLLLSGEGYTLAWPAGSYHLKERVNWRAGTFFASPTYWYHQHFNPGATPARYLSVNTPDLLSNLGLRFTDQLEFNVKAVEVEWEQELEKTAREH